jgi:hypothetical protein
MPNYIEERATHFSRFTRLPIWTCGAMAFAENLVTMKFNGGVTMRAGLATLLALVLCSNQASAEVVSLVCSGSMHTFAPSPMDIKFEPQASGLDIEHREIITPVGNFTITQVNDTVITFGNPAVRGTLDRLTGAMLVLWRYEGDTTDMQSGVPHKLKQHAELKCSVGKRLF